MFYFLFLALSNTQALYIPNNGYKLKKKKKENECFINSDNYTVY